MISWQRFVLVDDDDLDLGDGDERFEEVALQAATLFVRSGHGARERIEIKELSSEEAARRALARRIEGLKKKGYDEDGLVVRPAPKKPELTRAQLTQLRWQEAREAFEAGLPRFVREWQSLGFDPKLGFEEQAGRSPVRLHPNEIAEQCLALVEGIFGVGFTRRTVEYDPEHGWKQSVPARLVGSFYRSPVDVLVIARCKLRGECGSTDDADAPGLDDEIRKALRSITG